MKITVCKGCGQQMMAIDEQGNPSCVTCIGNSPDSGIPLEIKIPEKSKCCYCKVEQINTGNLPFYDSKTNTHYCGCRGWD